MTREFLDSFADTKRFCTKRKESGVARWTGAVSRGIGEMEEGEFRSGSGVNLEG